MVIKFIIVSFTLFLALNSSVFAQQVIKGKLFYTQVGNPTEPKPGSGGSRGDFVYYCQGDNRWNPSAYECDLGTSGCGPTSFAMIISTLSTTTTPSEVDREFKRLGARTSCNAPSSVSIALESSWFKSFGLTSESNILTSQGGKNILNLETANDVINQGGLILGSSRTFPCANCKNGVKTVDHIFVVDQVNTTDQTVSIRDPNNCTYGNGKEGIVSLIHKVDSFNWYYAIPIRKI